MNSNIDIISLQNLLDRLYTLIRHEQKLQEEKKLRGENFNVFTVLGFYHQEVRLHSAFLAELLNVKGSHGLKDVFLKSFIQHTHIDDLKIDTTKCITTVEYYIGKKTEEKGGRIDIIIETPESAIIIENKIYAEDQENQLLRYYNYANNKHYKNGYKLLYLTLTGYTPSKTSTGINKIPKDGFKCISYKDNLLKWLEQAVEIAARQPLVRETIIQYINIIKKLTGQNMEKNHIDELVKILSSSENAIRTSFLIEQNFWQVKRNILLRIKQFQSEIMNEINAEGKYKILAFDYNDKFEDTESGFSYTIDRWENHSIKFSFENRWFSGLYYGVVTKDGKEALSPEQKIELIKTLDGYNGYSSTWWTCFRYPQDNLYSSTWTEDAFVDIATTDNFKQLMKSEIKNLLDATLNLDM